MTESATGLVLRIYPLTETSLIVHWLTPQFGRISTAAKGARRPKSPFAGKLDLFYEADFSFSRSRSSNLHTLREIRLLETHCGLRTDIRKLRQAGYAAAFVEQTTETETPLPEIHTSLRGFLKHVCAQAPTPPSVFALELKLLHELGLNPNVNTTPLMPGTRKIMGALADHSWAKAARLRLTPAQTDELRRFLHGFMIFHLGRLPTGRAGALSQTLE